jgi:two-component sensor histidine kinase
MEQIIKSRAEKHLYHINLVAPFLWIVWIGFDYLFAPEHLYSFMITRFGGALMSVLIVINYHKKWVNVFTTQMIMFAVYNGILAYYLSIVPSSALTPYFNGYMMVMIIMYMILIIRFIDIVVFSLLAILGLISIILFGEHSFIRILGNGGFSFLTVIVLLIIFAILRYKGILRDISLTAEIEKARETEELNKTLKAANKEKETLLQEIHHRVKNNLQLVSSMLNLQKSFIDDERIKNIIQDSQQRVSSMSRIHQTLYRSKNFSSINIGEYLRNLTDEIIELYAGKTKSNIKVSYILDEVSFNIKEAIPIGLIANEIITNAVKHAFPNDRMGEINIELKNHVDYVDLKIKDNGIGMNAINNEDTINTLGRELIHSLVEQINAEIKIENSQGLIYVIRIPLPKE